MFVFLVLTDNLCRKRDIWNIIASLSPNQAPTINESELPQAIFFNDIQLRSTTRLTFPNLPTAAIMLARVSGLYYCGIGLIKTKMRTKACRFEDSSVFKVASFDELFVFEQRVLGFSI